MTQEIKSIEVVAAIIIEKGKIFITQRGYGEFKDMWEFPGGKIEKGESREDALKREIKEELNTEIDIQRHLISVEHTYPKFHLKLHCFICSVKSGDLTLLEHEAAKWVSAKDLDKENWLPADIKVIEELKALE